MCPLRLLRTFFAYVACLVLDRNHAPLCLCVDAAWFVAGTGIPQHGAQTAGAATAGVNVMPQSEFLQDGLLIKFEYYASSPGDVTFLVCRPILLSLTALDTRQRRGNINSDLFHLDTFWSLWLK